MSRELATSLVDGYVKVLEGICHDQPCLDEALHQLGLACLSGDQVYVLDEQVGGHVEHNVLVEPCIGCDHGQDHDQSHDHDHDVLLNLLFQNLTNF